jgi:hypothetical protein
MGKSGDNIIQKIDYRLLAKQFVDFFYDKWATNPNDFISNGSLYLCPGPSNTQDHSFPSSQTMFNENLSSVLIFSKVNCHSTVSS